jgi:hypothetical protein
MNEREARLLRALARDLSSAVAPWNLEVGGAWA